jgi:FG-GAP-like repeat/Secretion system C-terminal sorting domain
MGNDPEYFRLGDIMNKRTLLIVVALLLPTLAMAQVWAEHVVDGYFDGACDVHATDIDGDGDLDVLGAGAGPYDDISWWENVDGNGIEWVEHLVDDDDDGATSVYAADVDGDGDIDVIGPDNNIDIKWWENVDGGGLEWVEHLIDEGIWFSPSVHASDVDNDGDLDVLSTANGYNLFSWWENLNGDGLNWAEHRQDGIWESSRRVYTADVDGDGDTDVLGAAYYNGAVTWWDNVDGSGLEWVEHPVGNLNIAKALYASDVDGDGDIDVLGADYDEGDIVWWENVDGGGLEWVEHLVDGEFDGASSVHAMDVDGDGDTDVQGAADGAHDIKWWENVDGGGLEWVEHLVDSNFNGAQSVDSADMNGDGNIDILGAASSGDDINWWEITDQLIIVELPNGGEEWEVYTVQELRWSTAFQGTVIIELMRGETVEMPIAEMDGYLLGCSWNIHGTVVPADDYRIRITPTESGIPDVSDDFFTIINNESLAVTRPSGRHAWPIGTTNNIRWIISEIHEDVFIELIRDNTFERVISVATENDGEYDWTVPEDVVPDNNYRIRIGLLSGAEVDTSEASFSLTALPTLQITPVASPIIIPATGYGFWYWLEIYNPSDSPETGNYWTEAVLPGGNTYGPINVVSGTVGPWETYSPVEPLLQWVPWYAPAGMYEFVMHVGRHPNLIYATDSFEFEKLAGANVAALPESGWSVDDWRNEAWEMAGAPSADAETAPLPFDNTVSAAHPNPFNASATITVTLGEAVELSLSVYNVTGQKVADLADGSFNAGQHTFTFNGSNWASGLYFVHASVPGQLDNVQKVMLVR